MCAGEDELGLTLCQQPISTRDPLALSPPLASGLPQASPFFALTLAFPTPSSHLALEPPASSGHKPTPKKRPVPAGQRGTQNRFIPPEHIQPQHSSKRLKCRQLGAGQRASPAAFSSIQQPENSTHQELKLGSCGPPGNVDRGRRRVRRKAPGLREWGGEEAPPERGSLWHGCPSFLALPQPPLTDSWLASCFCRALTRECPAEELDEGKGDTATAKVLCWCRPGQPLSPS